MTLHELHEMLHSYFCIKDFPNDPSLNGIQVQNSQPKEKKIRTMAFAVDACADTIKKAIEAHADTLFVHHGLFWGREQAITGMHYERIKQLILNDIALYACHLPLDAHPITGHNYALARLIGLENLQPFGQWQQSVIGVKGSFTKPKTIDAIVNAMFTDGSKPLTVLPFGKKEIHTAGIISGGGAGEITQAIEQNLDVYITGEIKHENYHTALENEISLIAGGHYATEKHGLRLLMEKIEKETDIVCVFLESPTGL